MKKPNPKKLYDNIEIPESWTKGDHEQVYIDEIIVYYSLN